MLINDIRNIVAYMFVKYYDRRNVDELIILVANKIIITIHIMIILFQIN